MTLNEEGDREEPLFGTKGWVALLAGLLTILLTVGYQMREMTENSIERAIMIVDKRCGDLSDQHTRTFDTVLTLYKDLDDRLDRVEDWILDVEKERKEP